VTLFYYFLFIFFCWFLYSCASYSFLLHFFLFYMLLSFIISAFLHYIFIPIALCIYSLFLFISLFPSFYFSFFFSWRTRLVFILTVFISNLRQDSVYFTFSQPRWLHQWNHFFFSKFHYSHGCSPVFALQRFIRNLQIPKACLKYNLDKVYIRRSQGTNRTTVALAKVTGNVTPRNTSQCDFPSGA